jgi:heat shock protein HslJ/uncharacterized protein YecT (DUF1311 family)
MRFATLHAGAAALALVCGDALAATPIEECYQSPSADAQAHACLERMSKEASDALTSTLAAVHGTMEQLDRASGRPTAAKALDASQRAFRDFRERNCAWVAATLPPGSTSGDARIDCLIRMDRARADELRAQLARNPSQGQAEAGGADALTGVEWRLTRVISDGAETGLGFNADSPVSIRFDKSGRATGRGPINRFSGSYRLSGNGRISWVDPVLQTTSMAGPADAMQREDMFLQVLGQIYRFRITGSQLVLEAEDSNSSLTFDR